MSVAPGAEIDACRGAARKDDFVFALGVDEFGNFLAGGFVGVCRLGGHRINTALNGTVVLAIKIIHGVDDEFRLLRRCCAV